MSDTRLEHDLVRTTAFGDLPETRHLCLRCGAESVGVRPASPCPGTPDLQPGHNHPPFRPSCPERSVAGQVRGECLNDDGSDR